MSSQSSTKLTKRSHLPTTLLQKVKGFLASAKNSVLWEGQQRTVSENGHIKTEVCIHSKITEVHSMQRVNRMKERELNERIRAKLETSFASYRVLKGENLLYKLSIDVDGEVQPSDFRSPKRGQFAFQTDVMIKKDKVPLVVIETKSRGFSTHDVLTYSTKAMKHKEVYPHLRYGLAVGGMDRIDRKFFVHNKGFDFAVALGKNYDAFDDLVTVVGKQLEASEKLLEILDLKKMVRCFGANIDLV